jgi:tetratricopeptide (TPR) repeat protein
VKIFLGTWCGDTQSFLPKFIKIWEQAGLPINQLKLIALRGDEQYKQGPEHEELPYDIHRVPTFVFEREGKEIDRIVEHPVSGLEIDIAQISAGVPSNPSYNAVTELQSLFKNNSLDSLNSQYKSIARSLFGEASYVGELAIYAKKLHYDGEIEKAIYVYTLNTALFRYHPYSQYRLGVFKYECEAYKEAQEYLEKCKSIDPEYLDTNEYLENIATTEN